MMKTALAALALLLCSPLSLSAAGPPEALERAIQAKDWQEGQRICDGLPEAESRNPGRGERAASELARLSAQCAAVASGAGDRWRANWWWFTAAAMDLKTAQALLPELRSQGLLLDLLPARSPVQQEKPEKTRVVLPDGKVVAGTPARPIGPPKIPKSAFSHVRGVRWAEVKLEVLLDENGLPWQPVLLSARALPIHAFQAFAYLGTWRFTPAVVDGAPVASVYTFEITETRQ